MHKTIKNIPIHFSILLIFISSFLSAQENTNQTDINLFIQKHSNEFPGFSYAIIQNGKIIENKNFGLANLNHKQKTQNNTNYRLASVTKQFTAFAVLMLIDKDKLSFTTSLTDIFDDFPEYGKNITIQQLLTHTSGLLDYENLMDDNRTDPILDKEVLLLLKEQDSTKFVPGSKYDYSNSAYAVLAQVIEKISGKTFKYFMETEIFKPLKMDNSVVYIKNSQIKHRAYGYIVRNDSIIFNDQSMTSSVQGDGGIYTSLNDYFKWDQALENNALLTEKLKNKAYSIQSKIPKSEWDYGYGWRIKYNGKTKIISHSGHTSGFTNYVVKIPDQRLTVVLFSNRKNDDNVLKIGDLLLKKYAKIK